MNYEGYTVIDGDGREYRVETHHIEADELLLKRGEETHGTSGDIDEYRVYRAQPDNSESSLVAAWIKFTDESLDASVGSKQEREFSMEATNRAAAMSSQTAKVGDILTY